MSYLKRVIAQLDSKSYREEEYVEDKPFHTDKDKIYTDAMRYVDAASDKPGEEVAIVDSAGKTIGALKKTNKNQFVLSEIKSDEWTRWGTAKEIVEDVEYLLQYGELPSKNRR